MSRALNNWNLKLMALVLALALWSHVRGEVNPLESATFSVRLDARAPQGFVDESQNIPTIVRVSIRAPRVRLRELKGGVPVNPLAAPDEAPLLPTRFLRAKLDWTPAKSGTNALAVKIESNIEDAEILGVKPADVVVKVRKVGS